MASVVIVMVTRAPAALVSWVPVTEWTVPRGGDDHLGRLPNPKSKTPAKSKTPDPFVFVFLDFVRLEPEPISSPALVGEAMNLVREPDAGNPPARFDEREVETEHGMRLLRHRRGNPETEYAEAYPTAPPLDSTVFRVVFRVFRPDGGPRKCRRDCGYSTAAGSGGRRSSRRARSGGEGGKGSLLRRASARRDHVRQAPYLKADISRRYQGIAVG